jgi:hypothetical protein
VSRDITHASPAQVCLVAIAVEQADRVGHFRARLGARVIIATTRQPLCDGARILLRGGVDPDAFAVMRHAGSGTDALRGRISAAAQLTVDENPRHRFRPIQAWDTPPAPVPAPVPHRHWVQVAGASGMTACIPEAIESGGF